MINVEAQQDANNEQEATDGLGILFDPEHGDDKLIRTVI
jgi:hypothetical protein